MKYVYIYIAVKHENKAENVIHNNHIYETQQAAIHNYVLAQGKIGDTNSPHARLKEIPDNIYRIFSPIYKLLHYNFRLVIHGKNKIEPSTPQPTKLYIKSSKSDLIFSVARIGRMDKMKQKKKKTTINI